MMTIEQIASYTGLAPRTIDRLLQMGTIHIYQDDDYIAALEGLDRVYLEDTLPLARDAYESHLDDFTQEIAERYGVDSEPMSPFTLGNWVVGMLQYPSHAAKMIAMHERVPRVAVRESLHHLLRMLDDMPEGTQQWQRALCLLSFPLMTD